MRVDISHCTKEWIIGETDQKSVGMILDYIVNHNLHSGIIRCFVQCHITRVEQGEKNTLACQPFSMVDAHIKDVTDSSSSWVGLCWVKNKISVTDWLVEAF